MPDEKHLIEASSGTPQPFAVDYTAPHSDSSPQSPGASSSQSPDDSITSAGKGSRQRPAWRRILDTLNWMPPWCRWDPEHPPVFSMPMNVLFGFAGAFTVANLYYTHPILNILADDFHVSYETISHVPTLMQGGYATGLLFLCPLGDTFQRRPFVLCMVLFTATMWIGLCITNNFAAFQAISFIVAITTVTPQLMLPLVGDLAPPHKRAAALSIVTSGNLLGILIARILSGVLTNYTSWRNVYWLALGLQYLIFSLLWLFMPDYPSTNPGGINYFAMLWSILLMLRKHPVLVQACLVSLLTSSTFTSYWTTVTFLLAGAPYHYTPLIIGLWALIGVAGMCLCPIYARRVIDRFVPLFSVILGELMNLVGISLGTYTGLLSPAGPAIQAFALDMGLQTTQIANRASIYAVEPRARNRVNTAFMVFTFAGQLIGTSAGNSLYARGGWIASGSLSVGMIVAAMGICFARGPWETGWVGWGGGWSIRKKVSASADGKTVELASPIEDTDGPAPPKNESASARDGLSNIEKGLGELAGEDGENVVREINDERDGSSHTTQT